MSTRTATAKPEALPIDILILKTLCDEKSYTAKQLAELWGEDRTRIHDWLERFRKRGLVATWSRLSPVGNFNQFMWAGDRAKILVYLEARKDILA